jgi:hypothetical protein
MFKKAVFVAAPLAVLGGFAVAGTAHAATITYSDTSVSVGSPAPVVDEFTGITAASTTGLTPDASLTLTAKGNALGTLTWTNATAVSGTETATIPVPASGKSVNVDVSDGAAKASVTIAAAAASATATSPVNITLTSYTVTLPVATTDNTSGDVVFGTVPAGVTETLGNAPAGVALSNGVLSAKTAVPGVYKNVTVTATDSAAAAVETLAIDVKGTPVKPTPPPAPKPRPHLYNGHVITVNNNDAEIGWNFGPGVTCALTRTFGYGFSAANGSPHQGFTCYNPAVNAPGTDVGYWGGLAAGHGYDIQLIPAGTNRQPLPNAQTGWIYIHTTN